MQPKGFQYQIKLKSNYGTKHKIWMTDLFFTRFT